MHSRCVCDACFTDFVCCDWNVQRHCANCSEQHPDRQPCIECDVMPCCKAQWLVWESVTHMRYSEFGDEIVKCIHCVLNSDKISPYSSVTHSSGEEEGDFST